ncbi:ATP-dependent helicase HrpB [Enhydrobacter aerosaccus]|uniref:ATP-dependent helicase HrpB n=1 Tax=Enhydrobacter aerosaccus TaxID=225324 RepID=A0A1T4JQK4_9HYPH|nr:ATP-dependent helicase HrpB [Enhydrobacter aerosaccus]SJZ32522.1 ATP-dependent helicase HrpB [Enhydrobacter aerosaccus]
MIPESLPVDEALPRLQQVLTAHNAAVLVAPPGAGKTTRVPLALLDAPWLGGRKIVMQEPRRLAARAAARRMAATLGEAVGETVGYRVRLDTKVGPRTRIEVVTDGLFLRMLQDDPSLEGIGCVIFDELHERGLETDLSFALVRESQMALREELRVIAMSATLDPGPVSERLGGAPLVESAGRMFPVETRYLDREASGGMGGRIEDTVANAVRRALGEESGSALVFLPGVGEIRRVAERLGNLDSNVDVAPLYGDLSPAEQDRAISPSPAGRRKVVLATSIAETSLTIEGVRIVIDAGQMRLPRFSPRSGMTRLETVRVSQASADQRRGRAGRLEPGVCYRLWPEEAQRGLQPFTPPEILDADLAPLALELAAWGVGDAGTLPWLTPPPAAALATARALLLDLGAIEPGGAITPHGRAMVRLGQHPRLAHLVLKGRDLGQGRVAALLAAILSERDFLRLPPGQRDVDLRHRVDIALSGKRDGALRLIQEAARRLMPRDARDETPDVAMTGTLLALAYPDRIGRRRAGTAGRYLLSGGRGAALPEGDPMASEEFLVVADLDGSTQDSRIFLAAPITSAEIEELYAERIVAEQIVQWSARDGAVLARQRRRLGALLLEDKPLARPDPEQVRAAMLDGVRQLGLAALPWSDELTRWRERIAFLRALDETWPDLSDAALLGTLDQWLGPFLDGVSRRDHLGRVDLSSALRALVPWERQRQVDSLAPTHVEVPSGSRVPIDYGNPAEPTLSVRLQEMFGLTDTPRVGGSRVPVTLHLLSPARRPVQVTRDLASFWSSGYRAVKAELKGRYPRHYWPDDPLVAEPTARVRPRPR